MSTAARPAAAAGVATVVSLGRANRASVSSILRNFAVLSSKRRTARITSRPTIHRAMAPTILVPISAPIGLDPALGSYPILGDPSLAATQPVATSRRLAAMARWLSANAIGSPRTSTRPQKFESSIGPA